MIDQRRRGIAWVEHSLNRMNVAMQDLAPDFLCDPRFPTSDFDLRAC